MLLVSLAAKTALAATMSLSGHGYVTVAPGDTLGAIAAANGTTWQAVYAANRAVISDPNVVYAGEHLVMPGGGATAQTTAQTTAKVTAQSVGDGDNDGDGNGQAAPAATAPAPAQRLVSNSSGSAAGSASGGSGNIPPSFFSCVHFRESTNGQLSSNQFGILPSTWSAYGFPGSPSTASYSEQVKAFQTIYAAVGTSAWAPYDGC